MFPCCVIKIIPVYLPSETPVCKLKPYLHIISVQKWKLMLWFKPGRQVGFTPTLWLPLSGMGARIRRVKVRNLVYDVLSLPPFVLVPAVVQNRPPLLALPPALSDTLWSNLPCHSRWLWFYPRKHLNPTHSLTSSPVGGEGESVR